jgi:lysozyme family protein
MSAANFRRALDLVLEHEGGYVNDPQDPGGCTNMGITIGTYRAVINPRGTCADVRHLTRSAVERIYRRQYWDVVRGDDLPTGVDLVVFDFAVNSGPHRATKFLQRALGFRGDDVDGRIGPITLHAATSTAPDALVTRICSDRLRWLSELSTFLRFGRGWTRRVESVVEHAREWIDAEKKSRRRTT